MGFLKWLAIGSVALIGYIALNSNYDIKYKNGLNLTSKDKTHEIGFRLSDNTPYFNTLNRQTNFGIEHSFDKNSTNASVQRGKWEGRTSYDNRKQLGTITVKRSGFGLDTQVDNLWNKEKRRISEINMYIPRKQRIYPRT